ncbi:hypothetical protein [uncultured Mycobacterium sp.]|uniref:hypothetical protein n=1 Tax=uncultured Mycobacterium sp. TaxID=171292 RepID=UPI0035CA03FC
MAQDLEPPKLIGGKRYQDWTEAERRDAWLWSLGPRFRTPGMKPPPEPNYYLPPIPGSASDIDHACQGSTVDL